jgi:monosaccharide-transporting ATPase
MPQSPTILAVTKLTKSFPGVQALAEVDFSLRRGEIHALMGENGAGKSTLIKVLTGLYKRDDGQILLEDRPFEVSSPGEATRQGISTVYQEINLIPALSVAENIYLGRQPTRAGRIDWRAINTGAKVALDRLDVKIDVTQPVSSYSVAIQQLVAIARALDVSAKILILDEPTSSLDSAEVSKLFAVMRKLKQDGIAILFVTHFIDQAYQITDRITVLRNGGLVGEFQTASLPRVELVARMLGRELAEFEDQKPERSTAQEVSGDQIFFEARRVECKGVISRFDLKVRKGEVLGLAGLLGSGRTEMARLFFGADRPTGGKMLLRGKEIALSSPRRAIRHGFGLCPEDRNAEGIIPDLTVRENLILALQARRGIFKALPRKKQKQIVNQFIEMLQIKTTGQEQLVKNLSGGNQQKVIVGRWLASNPEFLILDEPTRGIDVGAKNEIQKLVISLSRQGMAILFISSELEEVIRCCTRVAVLRDRKKVTELYGDRINEEEIMHYIASQEDG